MVSYFIRHKHADDKFIILQNEEIKGAYRYRGLILNLKEGTLQYKNYKAIEIQPDNKPLKLLKLLIERADTIVNYPEIATQLQINREVKNIKLDTKDNYIADAIKDIKKLLIKILRKTGMESKKVELFIVVKKNQGYKLR